MKVNVVIIGHIDHGKSTLIGRLLFDSDSVTEGRVEEIQKLAQEYKRRFEFAYFIDSFDDELKEERTIDTTGVMFKGKNLYSVTDVPGHKEFIKNMLSGASHSDAAVLVVSAVDGIQEQTRRHSFLIHMLGIKRVFVLVNKMDAAGYQSSYYVKIKEEVTNLFATMGLSAGEFIPGSAMEGDNIYKKSVNMPWYNGPTLIEALDNLELVAHEAKPLRFAVQDNYNFNSQNITVGRIESGFLRKGDSLSSEPSGTKGILKKIIVWGKELECAATGDSIGLVTTASPLRGDVIGLTINPPVATCRFIGEVVLLGNILKRGETVELRCGTRRVSALVKEIKEKIDSETGDVVEKNPAFINEHEAATILFHTEPIVVEKFSEIPELGRFVLVRQQNIGAGIVVEKLA
jgi:small GTP-binding protein